MGIRTQDEVRQRVLWWSMMGMLLSLFLSRAALSITMMLFIAAALMHKQVWTQLKKGITNPLLLGMCLLFIMPLVSGLWSSNVAEWGSVVRIKLPLALLPLAFAGSWQFSPKQWHRVAAVFLVFLIGGTLWSTLYYLQNIAEVHEGYLQAKTLRTPLGNDHVRFSWLVSAGVLLCGVLLHSQKHFKALLIIVALWLALYLHLLAARTGLFSFYIMLVGYTIWYLWQQKNVSKSFYGLGALVLLPVAAFLFLPTFQNRIKYFVYDYDFIKKGTYLPGANDGARAQSYKGGWAILQENPFGVGAGDVKDEVNAWYASHMPNMVATDKLLPSSEWLLYGGFCGWMGVVLFTIIMCLPLFIKPLRYHIFWWLLTGTLAASHLFDVGLEVQWGVFIYSFFVLWWWKWFSLPQQSLLHEE